MFILSIDILVQVLYTTIITDKKPCREVKPGRKGGSKTMTKKQTAPAETLTAELTTATIRTAPVGVMDLEDIAIRFEMNLKRAKCLMEELTVEYFGIPNMSPQHPEYWRLFAGYEEYNTKADIVFDYLLTLKGISEELTAMSNQAFEDMKQIREIQPA